MNPLEENKLYESLDDKQWGVLETLNGLHIESWRKGINQSKEELLQQLNNQVKELFESYKGPAFKNTGDFVCSGAGDKDADVMLILKFPGAIATKTRDVFHTENRKNKNGDCFVYTTQACKALNILASRGLSQRTFHVGYVIPVQLKGVKEPGKLLTNLFSYYIRRRLEIVRPKCVLVWCDWTCKFVCGGLSHRGIETAQFLFRGSDRNMLLKMIGGSRTVFQFRVCRMAHEYSLREEEHSPEEIEFTLVSKVDPVVRSLKKYTEKSVTARLHKKEGGRIDGFALLSSGVRLLSTKKRKSFRADRKRNCEVLENQKAIVLKKKSKKESFFEFDPDASDLPPLPPVSWVVDQYVGLVGGNLSNSKFSDVLTSSGANMLISLDGREPPSVVESLNCEYLDLGLFQKMDHCIKNEFAIMESNTGKTYQCEVKNSGNCKIFHRNSFKALRIYSTIERIMTDVGSKKDIKFSHVPVVIIQTSNPQNTVNSGICGDSRSHIVAALVIYCIRDIISRMKNGLPFSIYGKLTIEPRVGTFGNLVEDLTKTTIPPQDMYKKNNSPFFDELGNKKVLESKKGSSSFTRESFEHSEMMNIIQMMNIATGSRDNWHGFTVHEASLLKAFTNYLTDMEANPSFRDPFFISDKLKEDHDVAIQETRDSQIHEDDFDQFWTCKFCVCPKHGHHDFLTNQCHKKCNTYFKWKEEHWKSNTERGESSIKSLFTLALEKVPLSDFVPYEEDMIDLQPSGVLMSDYKKTVNLSKLKCSCLLCKGKRCEHVNKLVK